MNAERRKPSNDTQRIKDYFARLRPDIVKKIYEIYEKDMLLFGYTFNVLTLEAGGFHD